MILIRAEHCDQAATVAVELRRSKAVGICQKHDRLLKQLF